MIRMILGPVLRALLGGPERIEDMPRALVLRNKRRNGCGGMFALLWLCAWTTGLISIVTQALEKDEIRSAALAIGLMGGIELVAIGFVVFSLFARETLRVEGDLIEYELTALVPLRRRSARMRNVENVDLFEKQVERQGGTRKSWMIEIQLG